MNYIEFMSVIIPKWMAASNQKAQELGFGSLDYWQWVYQSLGQLCQHYQNDSLVLAITGSIADFLGEQQKKMEANSDQMA